jgi:hypothetical protein
MTIDLLGLKIEAELLAHHAREEATDRVLLPMGRANDGRNRRSLWSAQHRQHASLFRARPAFARRASFGRRLARPMLLGGLLGRSNGSPLARSDGLGCRGFDLRHMSRTSACFRRSANRIVLDPDRSRPCLVMRSAMGPASASRRQARSEPLARTSSSSRARMSLSTACRTGSSVTFAGKSTPRSLRREAEEMQPAGQDLPRHARYPERSHYRSVRRRMPVLSG